VLVAPDDPSALSSALAALINSPARRLALGNAAREKFEGAFSFEAGIAAIAAQLEASVKGAQAERESLSTLTPAGVEGEG
jgi:glycosyltransferase involved in cell wall biosynthesis